MTNNSADESKDKLIRILKIIGAALPIIAFIIGLLTADFTLLFVENGEVNSKIVEEVQENEDSVDYYDTVYERVVMVKKTILYLHQVNLSIDESQTGLVFDIERNESTSWQKIFKRKDFYTVTMSLNDRWREDGQYIDEDWMESCEYDLEIKGEGGDGKIITLHDEIEINHAASIVEPKDGAMVPDRTTITGKLIDGKLMEGYSLYIVAYSPEGNIFYPQSVAEIDQTGNWTAEIDLSDKQFVDISQVKILALVGDENAKKEYQDYMIHQDNAGWKTVSESFHLSGFVDVTIMPEVCITNLSDNEKIGTEHVIEGAVKHLGEYSVSVVVYSYQNEIYYPQRINEVLPSGEWNETIYFGDLEDSEESFRLMVIFTKGADAQYINDYLYECEKNTSWPGVKSIPDDSLIGCSVDIIREKVKPLAEGSILYPEENAIVAPQENVEGVITDMQDGVSVYLVVYSNAAGKYYPLKSLEPNAAGEWLVTVYFGENADSGNAYKLLMIAIQDNGAKEYQTYLDECESEQSWPGIRTLVDGSKVVDEIMLTRD